MHTHVWLCVYTASMSQNLCAGVYECMSGVYLEAHERLRLQILVRRAEVTDVARAAPRLLPQRLLVRAWPSAVKSISESPHLNALNGICNRMYL